MTCDIIQDKFDDYLADLLSEEERQELEAHLEVCTDCAEALDDLKLLLEALKELPMEKLPEGFEASLHETLVKESESVKKKKSFLHWQKGISYAAAALLVVVIGSSGLNGILSNYNRATKSSDAMAYQMMEDGVESPMVGAAESTREFGLSLAPSAPEFTAKNAGALDALTFEKQESQVEESIFTPEYQKLIKRAQVSLEVLNYDEVFTNLEAKINALKGYVETSYTGTYTQTIAGERVTLKEGYLQLRMPSDSFSGVLSDLEMYGTVVSRSQSTDDITAQYRDVYQEMKNLEVREQALRDIMARAETIADIIEVERELSRVRSDINRYAGTLQGWDRQVAMSTIQVSLKEVRDLTSTVNPPREDTWSRAKEAFIKTINRLIETMELGFVAFVGALPFIILFVVLVPFVYIIIKIIIRKLKSN